MMKNKARKHQGAVELFLRNGSATPAELVDAVRGDMNNPSPAKCVFRMRKEGYNISSVREGRKIVLFTLEASPAVLKAGDNQAAGEVVASTVAMVAKTGTKKAKKAKSKKVSKKTVKVPETVPTANTAVPLPGEVTTGVDSDFDSPDGDLDLPASLRR